MADELVADLHVERQAEDLDIDVALGDAGFQRDSDLRQRSSGRAERVVAAPQGEPLTLRATELEGELRRHGEIVPQTSDNPPGDTRIGV